MIKKLKSVIYTLIDLPMVSHVYNFFYMDKIRSVIKKKNDSLMIEPYNVCNLKCIMCPYSKMTRPKVNMGMGLFKKVVDDAKLFGIKYICLTVYNEVFLDGLLFERIKYVKSKGLEVSFFSNATVMNKNIIDKLLECPPNDITFSFDSNNKETYEKIRVGASFEATKNNILNLIDERNKRGMKFPKIVMSMVLMNINNRESKQYYNYWSKKVDKVIFGYVDERKDNFDLRLLNKVESKSSYPCPRAFGDWAVLSDGRVTFCECQDFDGGYIIGDVKKQSLKEIYDSKEYTGIRQKHLNCKGDKVGLCKGCSYLYRSCFSWWFL